MQNEPINKNYWEILKKVIYDTLNIINPNNITLKMIDYLFSSPGKLVRPILTINLYKIFNNNELNIIPFAASIEVLHNASLIHDDIQDEDQYRRNIVAIWKKFSINQAINFGDFLFALSFEIINQSKYNKNIKLELIKLLTQTVHNLVKGQTFDIDFRDFKNINNISLDDYYKIIEGKTGSIFNLIFNGIVKLVKIKKKYYNDFIIIGIRLGKIYQINDDIIDYLGIKDSRKKRSEIISGNFSILSILTYNNLNKKEKEKFLKLLRLNITEKKNKIKELIYYYEKTDALNHAIEILNIEIKKLLQNNLMQKNKELNYQIKTILKIITKENYINI